MLRSKNWGWIWRNTGQKYQKSNTYRSFSQLDEASGKNQRPKSLVLPWIHGNMVGLRVNLRCVASSRHRKPSFAYKYCIWKSKSRLKSS